MLAELQALTAARSGHSATMNVGAGVLGSRILQILEVIASIVVPPPPKMTPYSVSLIMKVMIKISEISQIYILRIFLDAVLGHALCV